MDLTQTQRRPIGFWLKLLDRLIDDNLGQALRDGGLSRRQWQVLNVAQQDRPDRATLDDRLAPFAHDSLETVATALAELIEHGMLNDNGSRIELTAAGVAAFEKATASAKSARTLLMNGIAGEQYQATVSTLETMCRNLGWAPSDLAY